MIATLYHRSSALAAFLGSIGHPHHMFPLDVPPPPILPPLLPLPFDVPLPILPLLPLEVPPPILPLELLLLLLLLELLLLLLLALPVLDWPLVAPLPLRLPWLERPSCGRRLFELSFPEAGAQGHWNGLGYSL
ncbi:MAG: hypothetical protein KGI75_08430 [Rhizobiaceae bacterium]|nr:hypothetical protein [Rhizobiaceae bacterium]